MQADRYLQVHSICFGVYPGMDLGPPQWDPLLSPAANDGLAVHYMKVLESNAVHPDKKDIYPLMVEKAFRDLADPENSIVQRAIRAIDDVQPLLFPGRILAELFPMSPQGPLMKPTGHTSKAHALSAYAYYRLYMAGVEQFRAPLSEFPLQSRVRQLLKYLLTAARHANYAAAVQFVSPAVLLAGFALRAVVQRSGFPLENIKEFRPLARALESYDRMWADRRVSHRPPFTKTCAAERCRAPAHKGCQGVDIVCPKCGPKETSAAYCSIECQDQDWVAHQYVCKGEAGFVVGPLANAHDDEQSHFSRELAMRPGPFEHLEVMLEDEDRKDPRNGVVVREVTGPCPLGIVGREAKMVLKRYE